MTFPLTIATAEELDATLRRFIADVDYDIHKNYENDEETGEDTYDQVAEAFMLAHDGAVIA